MGYGQAPWVFKGRCLYQLQLVRSEEARKHIPPELRLVECFGHTLGGVYLARYDDSPVGAFDECVVMAGLVWNPPTSCAWAARVFVSDAAARDHGVASVGLPSRLAAFEPAARGGSGSSSRGGCDAGQRAQQQPALAAGGAGSSWWGLWQQQQQRTRAGSASAACGEVLALRNVQRGQRGLPGRPVALLGLPRAASSGGGSGWRGPRLRLSLPSFSGGTREHPGLLQYSCDLRTSVMPVPPMTISLPASSDSSGSARPSSSGGGGKDQHPECLDGLLTGRPLVCLAFNDMLMKVEQPRRLALPAAAADAADAAPQLQPQPLVHAFAAVLPWAGAATAAR